MGHANPAQGTEKELKYCPETVSPEDDERGGVQVEDEVFARRDVGVVGASQSSSCRTRCVEQVVLDQTIEYVENAFQNVLRHWGFEVVREVPRWNGRVLSSEAQEEMLVRSLYTAHEHQVEAFMDIFKHLNAWGFHIVPNEMRRVGVVPLSLSEQETREDEGRQDGGGRVDIEIKKGLNTVTHRRGYKSGGEGGRRSDALGTEKERKRKRKRGAGRKLNAQDFEAAVALDSLHFAQESDGLGEGWDDDEEARRVSQPTKRGKQKTVKEAPEHDGVSKRQYRQKKVTSKKTLSIVRDTLHWSKHIATHPEDLTRALDEEAVARLARISGSLVHASRVVPESFRLLKLAATLPEGLDLDDQTMAVCMQRIARAADCLACNAWQVRSEAFPRKAVLETIRWAKNAATLPETLVFDDETLQRVERMGAALACVQSHASRALFHCTAPRCRRSFSSLWELQAHFRAPIDTRGFDRNRGHGEELPFCPKCGDDLRNGQFHIRCRDVHA